MSLHASPNAPERTQYDVAIIGGLFPGLALRLLLRRWLSVCRVLIIEQPGERFERKMGEATVEGSACFLHLGLCDYV